VPKLEIIDLAADDEVSVIQQQEYSTSKVSYDTLNCTAEIVSPTSLAQSWF